MHIRLSYILAATSLALALAPDHASAQARRLTPAAKPEPSRTSDEEAIRNQAGEFTAAFARGDATAIAATWTEQAEYYEDTGVELHGRAAIQLAYADFFAAHPGAQINISIQSIRFPSRDLAVEEGVNTLSFAGPELPTSTRYLAIHVREDGQWTTAIGREWGAAENKLQDLAWLAGTWAATSPEGETRINFAWNDQQTALTGTFETIIAGKTVSTGHQRIIRHPQTGQIQSWIFDDAGGHGEAFWTHDGNKWLLDASGIAPDGTATAATNVLTRINDDEFMWRSVNRAAADIAVAPTDPLKLTRVKPAN